MLRNLAQVITTVLKIFLDDLYFNKFSGFEVWIFGLNQKDEKKVKSRSAI